MHYAGSRSVRKGARNGQPRVSPRSTDVLSVVSDTQTFARFRWFAFETPSGDAPQMPG